MDTTARFIQIESEQAGFTADIDSLYDIGELFVLISERCGLIVAEKLIRLT